MSSVSHYRLLSYGIAMHIHENAFFGASRDTEKAKNLVVISRQDEQRWNVSIRLFSLHSTTARHAKAPELVRITTKGSYTIHKLVNSHFE